MDVAAIVPAAGAGCRVGGTIRKTFIPLCREPLLAHSLRALQASPAVRWIVLVVRPGDEAQARALVKDRRLSKRLTVCVGGASRAESVAKGFAEVPQEAKWILVHDGARPCVSPRLIQHSVREARRFGAVACGLPATVTVKAADERGDVRVTLDRERLWLVQTPQVFRRDWFAQALAQADHRLDRFPDDAAIVESAGFPVRMIPGDSLNVKVTTKDDLVLAEAILTARGQKPDARIRMSEVQTRRGRTISRLCL